MQMNVTLISLIPGTVEQIVDGFVQNNNALNFMNKLTALNITFKFRFLALKMCILHC